MIITIYYIVYNLFCSPRQELIDFLSLLLSFLKKLRRYHVFQMESKLAESKLKSAEGAQQKLQAPRKRGSIKRARNADKLRDKVGEHWYNGVLENLQI